MMEQLLAVASSGLASCGDVLRNHLGVVCLSFSYNLGICSIVQAKLWAILLGIMIVGSRGFRSLQVKSNSIIVVNLIRGVCPKTHFPQPLVEAIRELVGMDGVILWSYIYKEANQVADALAKHELSIHEEGYICNVLLSFLHCLVMANLSSILFPRGY